MTTHPTTCHPERSDLTHSSRAPFARQVAQSKPCPERSRTGILAWLPRDKHRRDAPARALLRASGPARLAFLLALAHVAASFFAQPPAWRGTIYIDQDPGDRMA